MGLWVIAPRLGEGLDGVDRGPGHDRGVVDGDEEAHAHLEPADDLAVSGEAAERQGSGSAPAVADCEIEPQDWDTRGQQCDQVGDQEGAAAVFVGDVGEAPNVSEADGRTDGGHEKHEARVKSVSLCGRLCGGFSHTHALSYL